MNTFASLGFPLEPTSKRVKVSTDEGPSLDDYQNELMCIAQNQEQKAQPNQSTGSSVCQSVYPISQTSLQDQFAFSTDRMRLLAIILDCLKFDHETVVDMHVRKDGVKLYVSACGGTMSMVAILDKQFFSAYTMQPEDAEIITSLLLPTLHTKIKKCLSWNAHEIEIKSDQNIRGKINVIGDTKCQISDYRASMRAINTESDGDPTNTEVYSHLFVVDSAVFARCIDVMVGPYFTMGINKEKGRLEFFCESEDKNHTTNVDLILDDLNEQDTNITSFRATFMKKKLALVTRAKAINNDLRLGLCMESEHDAFPLYVSYTIAQVSNEVSGTSDSIIQYWIAPQVEEEQIM